MKKSNYINRKNNLSNLSLLIIVLLFFLLFISIKNPRTQPRKRAQSSPKVTLSFDPNPISVSENGEFTTTLRAAPSTEMNVQGYNFVLNFEKNKLELLNIEYDLGVVSIYLGDDNSKLNDINNTGYLRLYAEIQSATGYNLLPNNKTNLITLRFKLNGKESTKVWLSRDDPANFYKIETNGGLISVPIGLSDLIINYQTPTNQPTNTPIPTPTPIPNVRVTLNFKLKFQGINNKPKAGFNDMNIKITLVSSTNQYTAAGEFKTDESGIWSGRASFYLPLKKKYRILIKGPKHLQKKICDTNPTENSVGTYKCRYGQGIEIKSSEMVFDFSNIFILAGDLSPQDGLVDSYDVSLIRNNLNKSSSDVLTKADLDYDGIVTARDYSLIIYSLINTRYDEEI